MSFDLPDLPDGWQYRPVGSCAKNDSVTYGVVQPGTPVENGVPMIRVNNFRDTQIDLADVIKIAPEIEAKYSRTRLTGGEVLLTLVGSVGHVSVVTKKLAGFNVARAIGVIHPVAEVSPEWIAICLRSPLSQHLLTSRANTTVQTTINLKDVRALPIPIPPIAERNRITQLVSALDDRINLLRGTNATLEAIAQAIFKSWFVDFDPVRAKQEGRAPEGMDDATAALFPDSFEESELGLVPRGWRVGKVSDIADIKGGKQLEKMEFSDTGPNPVFGGAGVMGHTKLSNATGLVITVGRVGAYCGQFFWHFGDAWVNNNASRIVPNCVSHGLWLYQWLKQADIDRIKKGAAQPFVSNGDIAAMHLVIPAEGAIQSFAIIAGSVYERLQLNNSKAQTLATLRDTLLPRLISGQLRLPDAEGAIAEVAA
jgi:type I restriction enzyme S subunit